MDTSDYREDHRGNLVPISNIKEIDLLRDETIEEIVIKSKSLHNAMAAFKNSVFNTILSFCQISAEKYGIKFGGKKGNIQLHSFNGRYRVLIAVSNYITFDERLHIAKQLIDECVKEWISGANSNIIALVNNAFEVDKQGKISTDSILGLRRIKIDDPKWITAMEAISDAIKVTSSKEYFRIYERDKDGQYKQIPLDLSSI